MTTKANYWLRLCLIGATMAATTIIDVDRSGLHLQPPSAHGVIGRPRTPGSYAGVARRTTRRTSYATVARAGSTLTTLPDDCEPVPPGYSWLCSGVRYTPVYDGPEVVYVAE